MRPDEAALSRRYARAAMLYCDEHGGHDEFLRGLGLFADVLERTPLVSSLLTTPVLKKEGRQLVVREVARQLSLQAVVVRFLEILVLRGRVQHLPAIRQRFSDFLDAKRGQVRGQVSAPVPLVPAERTSVAAALSARFRKEVLCSYHVDETLYGGVLARVGNTVIDGSIRGRLERARKRIGSLT